MSVTDRANLQYSPVIEKQYPFVNDLNSVAGETIPIVGQTKFSGIAENALGALSPVAGEIATDAFYLASFPPNLYKTQEGIFAIGSELATIAYNQFYINNPANVNPILEGALTLMGLPIRYYNPHKTYIDFYNSFEPTDYNIDISKIHVSPFSENLKQDNTLLGLAAGLLSSTVRPGKELHSDVELPKIHTKQNSKANVQLDYKFPSYADINASASNGSNTYVSKSQSIPYEDPNLDLHIDTRAHSIHEARVPKDLSTSDGNRGLNPGHGGSRYATLAYDKIVAKAQLSRDNNHGQNMERDFRYDLPENSTVSPATDNKLINATSYSWRTETDKNYTNPSEEEWIVDELMDPNNDGVEKDDFIKLIFTDLRNPKVPLQFRSYLDSFDDKWQPSSHDIKYVGRPNSLPLFDNISRTVGVSFIVPALSRGELKYMYKKLNRLTKMVMPIGTGIMVGPMIKATIGDYLIDTPALITSLDFNIEKDYPWEINLEQDETTVGELPQIIKVSMGLRIIGKGALEVNSYTPFQVINRWK